MQTARASTRRAALAAFLLFAAGLFVVGPAEASRTATDARLSLTSSSSRELASLELSLLEPLVPADTSPRFGFVEDLSLIDVEACPCGFELFGGVGTRRCALTYARNNPLKYVDPDGRAIETPWDVLNIAFGATSLVANATSGNLGGAAVDLLGLGVDVTMALTPGAPGGAGSAIRAARIAENARSGRAFERLVLEAIGVEKNTKVLSEIATKTATIPDILAGSRWGVTDVKHVNKIWFTKQLHAELAAAKTGNLPFNLIVSSKTVSISRNLVEEIRVTGGKVYLYDTEKKLLRQAVVDGAGKVAR